jgi:hypothetical protein
VTSILIGVDATARPEDAIAFGGQLAHATRSALLVASVVHGARSGPAGIGDVLMAGPSYIVVAGDIVREELDETLAALRSDVAFEVPYSKAGRGAAWPTSS